MIHQDALPPFTMRCDQCGHVWEPPAARGQPLPTASSLDREAMQHWRSCNPKAQLGTKR